MRSNAFTLIELLIVIAVLSVLVGLVIVQFGDELKFADDGVTKVRVVSISNHAVKKSFTSPPPTGNAICDAVRDQVRDGKNQISSDWTSTTGCTGRDDANDPGELCCASDGTEWVVWGAYEDFDYTTTGALNDVYCTDDDEFSNDINVTSGNSAAVLVITGSDYKCE